MSAAAKTKVGKRACPICSEPVHVRTNAAGTVSIACHECDFAGYAKAGTAAARKLTEGLVVATAPAPGPGPAPAPAPAKGEPAKRAAFELGDL